MNQSRSYGQLQPLTVTNVTDIGLLGGPLLFLPYSHENDFSFVRVTTP